MIQASELRHKNWILYGAIPTVVEGIDDEQYKDPDGVWYPLDSCFPIPFDESILLKAGFEKRDHCIDWFIRLPDTDTH